MCRPTAAKNEQVTFAENEQVCTIPTVIVQQFEATGLKVKVKRTFVQLERQEWWDIVCRKEPQGARRRASSDCRVPYAPAARGRGRAGAESDSEDSAPCSDYSPSAVSADSAPAEIWADAADAADEPQAEERTTLMLKNIPSGYLCQEVTELLDSLGLRGQYNFVHVPVDCFSGAGLGYGFVNMTTGIAGARAFKALRGFCTWRARSRKVLAVCWSAEQGLEPLIERYRNSRMMHHSVPDTYKPLLLAEGQRIAFPPSTKRILKPRCMPAQGNKKASKDQKQLA